MDDRWLKFWIWIGAIVMAILFPYPFYIGMVITLPIIYYIDKKIEER